MSVKFCALFLLFLWHAHKTTAEHHGCLAYTPVYNETNCPQEYVEMNDQDANIKRPLCFMTDIFVAGSPRDEWPCFAVNGTEGSGRHIEVLIEMSQDGNVCIDSDVQGDATNCQNGRTASMCGTVPGGVDNIKYTVYCDANNCNVDIKFWYRIIVEQPDPETGNFHDNWCNDRTETYPSSLKTLPAGLPVPQPVVNQAGDDVAPDTVPGAAGVTQNNKFTTVLFLSAVLMIVNKMML